MNDTIIWTKPLKQPSSTQGFNSFLGFYSITISNDYSTPVVQCAYLCLASVWNNPWKALSPIYNNINNCPSISLIHFLKSPLIFAINGRDTNPGVPLIRYTSTYSHHWLLPPPLIMMSHSITLLILVLLKKIIIIYLSQIV